MKRKLNEHDVPEAVSSKDAPKTEPTFGSFALDPRLMQAVQKEVWAKPTPVQAKAIPLALEGNSMLVKSHTGTGKTAAYLLPILETIIRRHPLQQKQTSTLILVPTKELALQVTKLTQKLSAYTEGIRVENLAGKEAEAVQRARLANFPDIVVATPSRAASNVNNGALSLSNLAHLVLDEADLVMSYGFKDDLEILASSVPKGVQIFLMSATLNTEVDTLKGLFCRDPVILSLDQEEKDAQKVKQYVIRCGEDEKFLLLYAMFVLKLINGKTIIFVGDIDRAYRVKLFLEQFGIKSVCLNSELPLATRLHTVEEFNKGVYDILIASDENEVLGIEKKKNQKREEDAEEEEKEGQSKSEKANTTPTTSGPPPKKKRKGPRKDQDSSFSRGIDFLNVSCILSFDMPLTYKSYFHRIGRTARAGKTGTAISFVIPKALFRKHKPTSFPSCENDEDVLAKIEKHQKEGQKIEPYDFDMKRLEPFKYRLADALRAVTRIAIREARIREIRQEMLKSEKLSRYFAENPSDLAHLRHDGELRSARIQPHLKHVPDYLLPGGSKKAIADDIGFVGMQKDERKGNKIRRNRALNKAKGKGRKVVLGKSGKVDPLKTFNARGRGKK